MAPLRQTEAGKLDVLLLGPVLARRGRREIAIRGTRPLALLSLLALRAGERVSADDLVDGVWGDEPPAQARHALHVFVSTFRAALGTTAIETSRGAYRLNIDPDRVDALRFRSTVRGLVGDHSETALVELRQALGLWRGPAFGGAADSARLRTIAEALDEERLDAFERTIDLDLERGRGTDLIGELKEAVAANPLREHLRAQLMLALYRDGRQADALSSYREARNLLARGLGLEPGPALRELEQAILRQDPMLVSRGKEDLVRFAYALLTLAAAVGAAGPPSA